MFITSRRTWARASRAFLFILAILIAVGGFAYLKKTQQASAEAAANATPPSAAPAATGAAPQPASPTPMAAPAPRPNGGPVVLPPMEAVGQPAKPVAQAPATPAPAAPTPAPAAPPRPAANPVANPDALLADAKAKLDAQDYLGVRAILNQAICNDGFAGPAADQARSLQAQANNVLVFSARRFENDPFVEIAPVDSAGMLVKAARAKSIPWELVCRINGVSDKRIRPKMQLKVPVGPFSAVVNKQAFRMDLYLGGLPGEAGAMYVASLPVGLGKDDSTPLGLWSVVPGGKMKDPSWTNPRTNEHFEGYDPKNPLGGYWIALKGDAGDAVGKTSYGIHGTIDPDSIGKQASMGCVRLKVEDVKLVYDLMTDGKSRVLIRE